MADGYISQIKTPDNKVYDFRDQHLKVYTGSCTTAAGTAIKDVTTDGEFTLAKGAVVFVNFSVTNTAAVGNLKLRVNSSNESDAKAIKWLNNANDPANIPGVGYLRANQTYMFRYDGTNWVVDLQYDYNSNTYDRTSMSNNKKARVAITAGSICVGNSDGYAGIDNGIEFDITYPILYQPTAMAINGVRSDFYLYYPSVTSTVNTTGLTHVANGILYMTGTLSGTTFTCNSNTLTYTIPTTEDGIIYIPVAINTNATTQSFYFLGGIAHLFWYKDDAFREYNGRSIKSITRSGTTFTATRDDGSTFTFTQQDNAGITSVTIGATSPVQSSTSTAQTGSSASTTISLKDAYGDTKNPYGAKAKNLILAGPASGSNAAPTFRALIAADIPALSYVPAVGGANDINTLYNTGIYNITSGSLTNGPTEYGFGQLLVMSYRKHTDNTKTDWATQIYAHLGSGNNGNTLYYRTSNASTWQTWQMVAHANAATAMGDEKKPIYINAKGEIQEGTALKDLAYISKGSGTTKFLREDGTWQTALTSHQSLAAYAKLASPEFTGTPTAPTAANGTSTTQIATTEFVNNTLSYVNAMRFKGTLGTGGTITALPASHEAGDTYRVITAGTWAGKDCAIGTLIICTTDGTAANDAHWACVGTNEDGTIIGPESSTDNAIVRFNGATGKVIQDSKVTIDDNGNLLISHATSNTMTADSTNPKITFAENGSQPVHLIYTDYNNYRSPAGLKIIGGTSASPAWLEVEGNIYAAAFKGHADSATSANHLYPFSDGTNVSGTTNVQILQTIQNNDNTPRSVPFGVKLSHGNTEVGFGYFYPKTSLYGGWYIASYGGPSYVAVTKGTWESYRILTSKNTDAGTNNAATLAWNTTYTIAKINGTDIKFTTMAQPSYAFTDLTAHPTTLSGYGITDAASSNHSHTLKIGNKSLSVSTSEQEWTVHDIMMSSTSALNGASWDITDVGIYRVGGSSMSGEQNPGSSAGENTPYAYGHLIVTRAANYGAAQFYISDFASAGPHSTRGIRYRSGWNVKNASRENGNSPWHSWATILDDKNFNLYAPTLTGAGASGTWGISITGNADTATAANLTSTANAVAYYTNTTGTFGSKASANGALYATSANGALQWGTLPIAQGGTGVVSFTKNQVILSDNTNGTTGLTSRAYSDSSSAGALSNTSTNFVTERDVYFGLPTLNNAHNYTSSSTYYAPTAGGTAGHILIGAGATTAPAWYGGTVMSGTAAASWKTAFNGTTDATATNAAAVTIAGGLGIAKKLYVGDTVTVPDLTIGSTNEYGDAYTPIYWHEGVPTAVTLTQQCAFTIKSGKSGVRLSHAAITVDSYVAEIVITSGESKLNSAISWTSAAGYIELTCSSTVSGNVTGYIMISRGGEITATATDIT